MTLFTLVYLSILFSSAHFLDLFHFTRIMYQNIKKDIIY